MTAAAAVCSALLTACGGGSSTPTAPTPTSTGRPSTPGVVAILAPRNGQVVHGSTVTVRVSLRNATISNITTRNISPYKGHIHLYLDNFAVSTRYGLTQTLRNVTPGAHQLRAEFVAADHIPFNPRVFVQIAFEDVA